MELWWTSEWTLGLFVLILCCTRREGAGSANRNFRMRGHRSGTCERHSESSPDLCSLFIEQMEAGERTNSFLSGLERQYGSRR